LTITKEQTRENAGDETALPVEQPGPAAADEPRLPATPAKPVRTYNIIREEAETRFLEENGFLRLRPKPVFSEKTGF
jgi:hypothetical protein